MKRVTLIAMLVAAMLLSITPAMAGHNVMESKDFHGFTSPNKPSLINIDQKNKSITFEGIVMAERHEAFVHPVDKYAAKGYDPDHWHLIISGTQATPGKEGRIPIIVGWATDVEVADALASVGATKADDKFDAKAYNDRLKKSSPYPDVAPKGTPIDVYVTWVQKDGSEKTVEANEFMESSAGKKLDFVYIGKIHPSHCIACLYGCPGGKIANTTTTVRDYFDRGHEWKVKKGVLPPDGTPVLITFKVRS
jgi:hypothetical protein